MTIPSQIRRLEGLPAAEAAPPTLQPPVQPPSLRSVDELETADINDRIRIRTAGGIGGRTLMLPGGSLMPAHSPTSMFQTTTNPTRSTDLWRKLYAVVGLNNGNLGAMVSSQDARTADVLYDIVQEYPQFLMMINEDYRKGWMTAQTAGGLRVFYPQAPLSFLIDTAYEMVSDFGYIAETVDQLAEEPNAYAEFDGIVTGSPSMVRSTLSDTTTVITERDIAARLSDQGFTEAAADILPGFKKGGPKLGVLDGSPIPQLVGTLGRLRDRPIDFIVAGDRMAFVVTSGEGDHVLDIQLDPDVPAPTDLVGAIAELVLAARGERNRVLSADDLPGGQTLVGNVIQAFGDLTRPVSNWWTANDQAVNAFFSTATFRPTDWRSTNEIMRDRANRAAQGLLGVGRDIEPADAVLLLAQGLAAQDELDRLDHSDFEIASFAVASFDDATPEEREQLFQGVSDIRKEVASEIAHDLEDDRHVARRFIEDVILEPTAHALSTWNTFTQRLFVGAADFLGDLGQGTWALATTSPLDLAEGGRRFIEAFEFNAGQIDNAHEYFTGPDWTKGWVDFTASMLGDPFVWITPGGKGLMQNFARMMGTRAGARDFVRQPQVIHAISQITDDLVGRSPGVRAAFAEAITETVEQRTPNLLGALSRIDGLSTNAQWQILSLGERATVTDIQEIIFRDIAHGLAMPSPTGHLLYSNTASSVYRYSGSGDSRVQEFLAKQLGAWGSERTVRTDGLNFLDDFLDMVRAHHATGDLDNKAANEWVRAAFQVHQDMFGNNQMTNAVFLERARGLYRQMRTARDDTVRGLDALGFPVRAGKLREPRRILERIDNTRHRLTQIDEALAASPGDEALLRERELLTNGDTLLTQAQRARSNAQRRLRYAISRNNQGGVSKALSDILEADTAHKALTRELGPLRSQHMIGAPTEVAPEARRLIEAYDATRRRTLSAVGRYRALAQEALGPGSDLPARRLYAQFLDDWGARHGLQRRAGVQNPLMPEMEKFDWTPVSGGRSGEYADDLEGWLRTLLAPHDPEMYERMLALGIVPSSRAFMLPTSTMQMVAYSGRSSDGAWAAMRNAAEKMHLDKVAQFARQTGVMIRSQFTAAVLLNFRTFLRSNLDEPLRHAISRGRFFGGRTGITNIAASGETTESTIMGPARAAVQRLFGRRGTGLSEEALLFAQPRMQPWRYVDFGEARLVASSKSRAAELMDGTWAGNTIHVASGNEYMEAASQWYNGVLGHKELVRRWAVARRTGDFAAFRQWWNAEGRTFADDVVRFGGTNRQATADVAYDAMDNWFDNVILADVRAANRTRTSDEIIRAWAEGDNIAPASLRQLGPVPSRRTSGVGKTGAFAAEDRAFDVLYGRPSEIGGGLIFQDYYAEVADILYRRHGPQGTNKLLTWQRLMQERPGMSELEAKTALNMVSPIVDDLVRNHGFITPRQIALVARRTARRVADHHMYHVGATSVLGERVRNLMPFGPAQWDFLQWYGRELTKPLELGLNPTIQGAFRKMGLGKLVDDTVPFLGRPLQVGFKFGGNARHIPLNLRLAARISDLMGYAASFAEQQEEDPDATSGPLALLNHATFMPLELNGDDFLIDFMPGLGPLPNFALHTLPLHHEGSTHPLRDILASIREFTEAVMPAMEFNDKVYGWGDLQGFISDFMLPDSKRSLRRTLRDLMFGLEAFIGNRTGLDFSPSGAVPPDFYHDFRGAIGTAIAENPHLIASGTNPEWTDTYQEMWQQAFNASAKRAVGELGSQQIVDMLGGSDFLASANVDEYVAWLRDTGALPLHLYSGLMNQLDRLWTWGFVPDNIRDELTELWAMFKGGTATYDDLRALNSQLGVALFDTDPFVEEFLLATAPEMAAIGASSYMCAPNAPAEYCDRGELVIPLSGPEREAIWERGQREGWIRRKPAEEFARDVYKRWTEKMFDLTARVWTEATGSARFNRSEDERTRVFVQPPYQQLLERIGVELDMDGNYISKAALSDAIDLWRTQHGGNLFYADSAETPVNSMLARANPDRMQMIETGLDRATRAMRELAREDPTINPTSPSTWPEWVKEQFRNEYREAVDIGEIPLAAYEDDLAGRFGSLHYEPPTLPTADDATFTVHPGDVTVVDGDTVALEFSDGAMRVRLIGVNAADRNSANERANQAYLEQNRMLQRVVDIAIANNWEISFAFGDPRRFSTIQQTDPRTGEERLVMWMMVNGVVVYDPGVFTTREPTGISLGGEGIPASVFEALNE